MVLWFCPADPDYNLEVQNGICNRQKQDVAGALPPFILVQSNRSHMHYHYLITEAIKTNLFSIRVIT
jgi:hypothetical protein